MAKNRNEQASRSTVQGEQVAPLVDRGVYQSGIVDKALVDRVRRISDPDPWRVGDDPPWSIVERYLTTGEYRELIEEHARTSRAFADVLEALRNDEEEGDDAPSSAGSYGGALDLDPEGAADRLGGASVFTDPREAPRSRGRRPPLRVVR